MVGAHQLVPALALACTTVGRTITSRNRWAIVASIAVTAFPPPVHEYGERAVDCTFTFFA